MRDKGPDPPFEKQVNNPISAILFVHNVFVHQTLQGSDHNGWLRHVESPEHFCSKGAFSRHGFRKGYQCLSLTVRKEVPSIHVSAGLAVKQEIDGLWNVIRPNVPTFHDVIKNMAKILSIKGMALGCFHYDLYGVYININLRLIESLFNKASEISSSDFVQGKDFPNSIERAVGIGKGLRLSLPSPTA